MTHSLEDKPAAPTKIANMLAGSLRTAYPSEDVNIKVLNSIVTISRGKPAVQVFVKGQKELMVSLRSRATFRMEQKPYSYGDLAALIESVIGPPAKRLGIMLITKSSVRKSIISE